MRVLICPDKFAGTLSAPQAAAAIRDGWGAAAADDRCVLRPLSDGGPGFLDVLATALGGRRLAVATTDPLGRPTTGELLIVGDTVYLESAQACGLHLLAEDERDPTATTSYGLGLLIAAAVETGVRRIVVGLGGTATIDGGAGMLAALGAVPLDAAGYALPYGGGPLAAVAGLDGPPRLRDVALIAAVDVDNPLTGPHGAATVFGPQKGAAPADVVRLDAALTRFAAVLEALPTCPAGLAARPGSGAAGGIAAALLAVGGRCESGMALVRRLTGLDDALDATDLVITGEGSFDRQSLRGKVVAGVAGAARRRDLPCLVVAGRVGVAADEATGAGVTEAHSLIDYFGGGEEGRRAAMTRPAEGLRGLSARLARRWSTARQTPAPNRPGADDDPPSRRSMGDDWE